MITAEQAAWSADRIAEYAPLPQDIYLDESYELVASDVGLTMTGLVRATLVTRALSSAQRLYAMRPPQVGGFLEATVHEYETTSDGGLVLARDATVADKIGLWGNVVTVDDGYQVTLPRDQNQRRGNRFVVPFAHSVDIHAAIEARNDKMRSNRAA